MTDAEYDAIAARIDDDAEGVAAAVLRIARGSPDVAIAILGVAIDRILDTIDDPTRRAQVLANYLDSFSD